MIAVIGNFSKLIIKSLLKEKMGGNGGISAQTCCFFFFLIPWKNLIVSCPIVHIIFFFRLYFFVVIFVKCFCYRSKCKSNENHASRILRFNSTQFKWEFTQSLNNNSSISIIGVARSIHITHHTV